MARLSLKLILAAAGFLSLSGHCDETTTKVNFVVYPPDAQAFVRQVNEDGWSPLGTADKPVLLSKKAHFNQGTAILEFRAPGREKSEEKSIVWTQVAGDKTFETGVVLKATSPWLEFQDWRKFTPWANAALGGMFLGLAGLLGYGVWLFRQNLRRKEHEAHLEMLAQKGISAEMRIGNYYRWNRIGQGGGGTVYRAVPVDNPVKEASVALKMLDDNLGKDHEFQERFRREIDATSKLHHRNVISIYEFGEYTQGGGERGILYFVMEFLQGVSLETYMSNQQGRPLSPALVGDFIRQAAAGLHHAHEKGLVHRDVKGDNLFLVNNERVVVIDFGLARKPKQTIQLTRDANIPGTTLYMPPESENILTQQDEQKYYTQSYDQFSLATLAFEMLTTRRPFICEGDTTSVFLIDSLRYQGIHSVQEFQPHLSSEFDAVFQRALSRDPASRFPDIIAFADALAEVCEAISPPEE